MAFTLTAGAESYDWILETSDSFDTILAAGYLDAYQSVLDENEVIECRIHKTGEIEYREIYVKESTVAGGVVVEDNRDNYIEHGLAMGASDAADISGDVSTIKTDVQTLFNIVGSLPPTPSTGSATFNATPTVNTKTVVVNVNVSNMNAAGVYITRDDATAPTLLSQFNLVSFNDTASFSIAVPAYNTDYAIRAWAWDSDAGAVVQATDGSGNTSITVQAIDTNGPTKITYLDSTAGTDPTTQRIFTYTRGTDSGVGLASQPDQLWTVVGGQLSQKIYSNMSSGTEVGGFTPGTEQSVAIVEYDAAGNFTVSDTHTFTTSANADEGEINLTADLFTADDTDSGVTVTASRSLAGASELYCKYKTEDAPNSAVDGINYYGRGEFDVTGAMTREDATYGKITLTDIGLSVNAGEWMLIASDGASYGDNYSGLVQAVADTDDTVKFLWSQTTAGSDPGAGNDDDGATSTVHTGIFRWAAGNNTNQSLIVNNKGGPYAYNYGYFGYIITDSNNVGSIGSTPSAVNEIDGTGAAAEAYQQSDTAPYAVCIELESVVAAATAADDGKKWQQAGPSTSYSNNYGIQTDDTDSPDRGTATLIDAGATHIDIPIAFTQTGEHAINIRATRGTFNMRVHGALLNPIVSIGADNSGGAGYALVTCQYDHGLAIDNDGVHAVIDGTAAHDGDYAVSGASGKTFNIPNQTLSADATGDGYVMNDATEVGLQFDSISTSPTKPTAGFFAWAHQDSSNADRTCYVETATTRLFRIYQYMVNSNGVSNHSTYQLDKLILAPVSEAYDPNDSSTGRRYTDDEYYGIAESTKASGVATDVNIPSAPKTPPPTSSVDPTSTSPADAATGVSSSIAVISAVFNNMTNVTIDSFTVESGGGSVSGTATVVGNTARFTFSGTLIAGQSYNWTLKGTVVDGGVLKAIGDPDTGYVSSFTVYSTLPTGQLLHAYFDDLSVGPLTPAVAASYFSSDTNIIPLGTESGGQYPYNGLYIVDSGDPARGNMLRWHQSSNAIGLYDGDHPGSGGQLRPLESDDLSSYSELWARMIILIPDPNPYTGQTPPDLPGPKFPMGFFAENLQAFEGIRPPNGTTDGWSMRMVVYSLGTATPNRVGTYWYDNRAYKTGTYDPTNRNGYQRTSGIYDNGGTSATNQQRQLRKGVATYAWLGIKLNTPGSFDGEMHLYMAPQGDTPVHIVSSTSMFWLSSAQAGKPIAGALWQFGFGGSGIDFMIPNDMALDFDNMDIFTSKPSELP